LGDSFFFFAADIWSEFTLRPKAPQDRFPSLKLLHAGRRFIPADVRNLHMIKAERRQN